MEKEFICISFRFQQKDAPHFAHTMYEYVIIALAQLLEPISTYRVIRFTEPALHVPGNVDGAGDGLHFYDIIDRTVYLACLAKRKDG